MQHHFRLHGLLALSALHLADPHVDSHLYTPIAYKSSKNSSLFRLKQLIFTIV